MPDNGKEGIAAKLRDSQTLKVSAKGMRMNNQENSVLAFAALPVGTWFSSPKYPDELRLLKTKPHSWRYEQPERCYHLEYAGTPVVVCANQTGA